MRFRKHKIRQKSTVLFQSRIAPILPKMTIPLTKSKFQSQISPNELENSTSKNLVRLTLLKVILLYLSTICRKEGNDRLEYTYRHQSGHLSKGP